MCSSEQLRLKVVKFNLSICRFIEDCSSQNCFITLIYITIHHALAGSCVSCCRAHRLPTYRGFHHLHLHLHHHYYHHPADYRHSSNFSIATHIFPRKEDNTRVHLEMTKTHTRQIQGQRQNIQEESLTVLISFNIRRYSVQQ